MEPIWYMKYHGDAWEEMCHILLAIKHGNDYQPIGDKGGDLGLDGLVTRSGIAYQAYGQELENKDPAKGVKDKIHKDLSKLKKNASEIVKIIGDRKICHWVLLLNKGILHNSIHEYIKTKQDEVLSWGLEFIDRDFQVSIQPPSFLETEYLEYKKKRDDKVEVEIEKLQPFSIGDLRGNKTFLAIFDKFKSIVETDSDAENLAYKEIKNFLDYSAQLDEIQKREPDFYSAIEEIRSDVEEEAEQGSILEGSFTSFSNTKNTLENRLNNTIGDRLGANTMGRVRKFIIADWFVRCPLRFKNKKTEAE